MCLKMLTNIQLIIAKAMLSRSFPPSPFSAFERPACICHHESRLRNKRFQLPVQADWHEGKSERHSMQSGSRQPPLWAGNSGSLKPLITWFDWLTGGPRSASYSPTPYLGTLAQFPNHRRIDIINKVIRNFVYRISLFRSCCAHYV